MKWQEDFENQFLLLSGSFNNTETLQRPCDKGFSALLRRKTEHEFNSMLVYSDIFRIINLSKLPFLGS
jgi:hypothetical protein